MILQKDVIQCPFCLTKPENGKLEFPCSNPDCCCAFNKLAKDRFVEVWRDGDLLSQIATKMSCIECEALCGLLEELGEGGAAEHLRNCHVMGDNDEDDSPEHCALRDVLEDRGWVRVNENGEHESD